MGIPFTGNMIWFLVVLGVSEALLVIAGGIKSVWLYVAGLSVGAVGSFVVAAGSMGVGLALLLALGAVCGLIILWGATLLLPSILESGGFFW